MTQALFTGDEVVTVRAHDSAVFECRAVEDLQTVAGGVGELNHFVDPAVGQLGGGGFLVRRALDIETVADLLQAFGIRAFPAGLGKPVVLSRHDHQARGEVIHPQIERALGAALALDHAEDL